MKKLFEIILIISFLSILLISCATNVNTPKKGVFLDDDWNISISDGFISKMPDIERENQLNYEPWPNSVWIDSQQSLGFYLSSVDKKRHYYMVMGALENDKRADHSRSWYNTDKDTMGMVKILRAFNISGGICKYYQVLIQKKTKALSEIYLGCKYIGSENWSFNYLWWLG